MKLVIAVIQPERLENVMNELDRANIHLRTVSNALGVGRQKGHTEVYRGAREAVNLLKKVRIEVAVNEEYVDKAIDAVVKGARTGNIGDGKIFVVDLPECVRIRTGERGINAIG